MELEFHLVEQFNGELGNVKSAIPGESNTQTDPYAYLTRSSREDIGVFGSWGR